MRELDGLRALARSLVHGDAEVDDLIQDTAVAALEHPPATDRPVRPWLATVLRNRWRMDRRESSRRRARELAVAPSDVVDVDAESSVARARTLERLSAALVALDEPFRTAVIRRYLDGETAAEIARALGVPAGTVRWRLATGLARLREALDAREPRWARMLVPFAAMPTSSSAVLKGALLVKLKTKLAILIALALLVGGAIVYVIHDRATPDRVAEPAPSNAPVVKPKRDAAIATMGAAIADPLPGQGRATVAEQSLPGGSIQGRVINWSSGDGVGGADLTFSGEAGATTVRSRDDGMFELVPPGPGHYTLAAVAAQGFLPYAPEYLHSTVRVTLVKDRAVAGITVFLFPALDYHGTVVDAAGKPVANAKVKLLGTPAGEQAIDRPATEWTSGADGTFTFHAADGAVLEAESGKQRGWAVLAQSTIITKRLLIKLGEAPARDLTITGHVVDSAGHAVPDVLVAANPAGNYDDARSTAFAISGVDGAFKLEHLDKDRYDLTGEAEDRAPSYLPKITGGAQNVTLVSDGGLVIAGTASTADGAAVPAYTLTVFRKDGARRDLVAARSIVDPGGRFSVHVQHGDYELIAAASGWAPSKPTAVTVESSVADVKLTVTVGGTLRGVVQAADNGQGIPYARVMREARGGGASAQPANAGTVTRADGTFELTGIPAGSISITIGADGFNPKIEAGMSVDDGGTIGPITFAMSRLVAGQEPQIELVGIGVALTADGDSLLVTKIFDGGGKAAGIVVGDRVVAVDGASVTDLGMDGAIAKIRGVEGTTVSVTLKRDDQLVQLLVTRRKIRA